MITIEGNLAIRTIAGRHGDFNVAKLATSIGDFVIKDALLDQYVEGRYQGQFAISKIKPSYYTTGSGSLIVEIRAFLDSMTLDGMDDLSAEEATSLDNPIQDPIEEDKPVKPAAAPPKAPPSLIDDDKPFGMSDHEVQKASPVNTPPANLDADLFGTLWPLSNDVRLDATVDRLTQREQVKRLRELGYTMDFKTQLWKKEP